MVTIAADFYLPDDCWESVFKFFNDDDHNNRRCLKTLAGVSKQFLSITNRLRFSLKICNPTLYFLPLLLQRFTKLVSIDLSCYQGDLDKPIYQIARFPLKLTSLNLSNHGILHNHAMRTFSKNITTLNSHIFQHSFSP
jgi:F-box and leucine-rich repeat protein 2/20